MTPEQAQELIDAVHQTNANWQALKFWLEALVWNTGITAGGVWTLILSRALIVKRPIA